MTRLLDFIIDTLIRLVAPYRAGEVPPEWRVQ